MDTCDDLQLTLAAFQAILLDEALPFNHPDRRITLISADNRRIRTDYKSICVSPILYAHVQANRSCSVVAVPHARHRILRQMVRWMEHHRGRQFHEMIRIRRASSEDQHDDTYGWADVCQWNERFFCAMDHGLLLQIVPAACALRLHNVLNLFKLLLDKRPLLRHAIFRLPPRVWRRRETRGR